MALENFYEFGKFKKEMANSLNTKKGNIHKMKS